jgi:hypothetical protein
MKTGTPWGKTVGARRLLGAATPEFTATRKVTWKRSEFGTPAVACSSCGWAKGVGHDRWCRFVTKRRTQ